MSTADIAAGPTCVEACVPSNALLFLRASISMADKNKGMLENARPR